MANFNLGALVDWEQIGLGELIDFDIPQAGFRAVDFDILADQEIALYGVSEDGETWLLALGDGMMNVKFTTAQRVAVFAKGPDGALVSMRTRLRSQVIAENGEPSLTSIQPRVSSQDAEFQRMMMIMRLNTERREAQLRAEIEALAQRVQAADEAASVIEPEAPQDDGGAA